MVDKWNIIFTPTETDPLRYKVKLKTDVNTLNLIVKKLGGICGRPFTPTDKNYNFAFYVYGVDDKIKEKLVGVIREYETEKIEPEKDEIKKEKEEKEVPKFTNLDEEIIASSRLNPDYIFETFVVGKNNRFPYSACLQITESPGMVYNPLFIWGGVGLGKTHLLHSIGNKILSKNSSSRVLYVSTPDFIQEVIDGIREGKEAELISKYGGLDLLLIDDIQFLKEGEATQEIFFRIFEKLYNENKQIVIASDRPPRDLEGIADRLRSRFEWGLITDIKRPDIETRVAILKKKLEKVGFDVSRDILFYAANKLSHSVRELVGFINRLYAYWQMTKNEITIEDVKEMLGEEVVEEEKKKEVAEEKVVEKEEEVKKEKGKVPPPPEDMPPPPPETECPYCGGPLTYIDAYDRWYCYKCLRYAPPEYGKGKWGLKPKPKKKEAEEVDLKVLKELEEMTKPPEKKEPVEIEGVSNIEKEKEEIKEREEKVIKREDKKEIRPQVKKTEKKLLRKIQVGLFFPNNKESYRDMALEEFEKTIEKHKLHFGLEYVFIQDYVPEKNVNYAMFAEMCKTSNINICIVIGPSPESSLKDDEIYSRLKQLMDDEDICLEYISHRDLKQRFNYLNILLDIANFGHQKLGLKTLKELW